MGREAREFSAAKAYAAGDLVLYGGVLFEFTAAHAAGAWNGNDAQAVDSSTERDITRILTGMSNAEKAAAFAETLVFEPGLITGTRYKYTLTNADDPR